ncbi:hypothetical protein [Psychromonas sp. Urea-02u-13]|uniref:hypothetical protein n=1 Tax=Psychromonas sp. Urea-02u-13 TaxID=2058326 RepID=UPI000C32D1C0|nr:hypothetical protein [Psychromonas sp. Urea-02u-13]PKG39721.1 hypothetical protein CXF74_07145 [Psychromonas sp. Urea-02u-13]
MKHLILSTLLVTTSLCTFANANTNVNEHVFKSEEWKEVHIDEDLYWANLTRSCNEKFPGSRPPDLSDILGFSQKFKNEATRPQLYTFLRETFGFADSSDPNIQSAFNLNGKHQTIALPFYFHDPISYYNSITLFSIGFDENNVLTTQSPLLDENGGRRSALSLAPSLGEVKTFCILGSENS